MAADLRRHHHIEFQPVVVVHCKLIFLTQHFCSACTVNQAVPGCIRTRHPLSIRFHQAITALFKLHLLQLKRQLKGEDVINMPVVTDKYRELRMLPKYIRWSCGSLCVFSTRFKINKIQSVWISPCFHSWNFHSWLFKNFDTLKCTSVQPCGSVVGFK